MVNPPGFENLDKIRKTYPYFDLASRTFSQTRGARYCGGIPLLYDAETRRLYIDASDTHSLVYGSTGSLKTRTVVSPGIKVLGYAGESMVINDPKGELFARHAGDLKKQGYTIVDVNFRNPSVGNSWNPLYIPYQFYIQGNLDKSAEFVNDIANNLMLSDRSTDDPFWDFSASDLLYGLIQLLFRYCKEHHASLNAVNIGNLLTLRRLLFSGRQQPQNTLLWKYASEDELVAASLSGSVYAPKDTMNSILSVFDQKMRSFTIQPTLLDMLANNDFDIADIGKAKTAVFLITPDEKTSYHRLVSMFVKESYEYLIYLATQTPDNKVENRINYILDEFSSLPQIADMPSMISAARSRDIRFLLVVQSQSSLKQRYSNEAETIISNCTNWIFFTSRELSLLKELSELCGTQKNQQPNITIYDLQHFSKERREALLLAGRLKPAKVSMLDIDKFGDRSYTLLEHERHERQPREKLSFELREDVKNRYVPPQQGDPFAEGNPFQGRPAVPRPSGGYQPREAAGPQAASRQASASRSEELDALIRRIDQRIAVLEKEEAEERARQASGCAAGAKEGE